MLLLLIIITVRYCLFFRIIGYMMITTTKICSSQPQHLEVSLLLWLL